MVPPGGDVNFPGRSNRTSCIYAFDLASLRLLVSEGRTTEVESEVRVVSVSPIDSYVWNDRSSGIGVDEGAVSHGKIQLGGRSHAVKERTNPVKGSTRGKGDVPLVLVDVAATCQVPTGEVVVVLID